MNTKDPKWEGLKELARLLILAIVPVLITYLATVENPTVWILLGTAVLRAIDRAIHVNPDTNTNGLVPF